MRVLVAVDQATAVKQGLDAPNSTAWVEFDPAKLGETERIAAGQLFAKHKDRWAKTVRLVVPSVDALTAELRRKAPVLAEREAQARAWQEYLTELEGKLKNHAPELLHVGSWWYSGEDCLGRIIKSPFSPSYITVKGYYPRCAKTEYHQDENGEVVEYDNDRRAAEFQYKCIVEPFAAWQAELTKENLKLEKAAKAALPDLVAASNRAVEDYLIKHGDEALLKRLKLEGPSRLLVREVLKELLLADYPEAFDWEDEGWEESDDKNFKIAANALPDDDLRTYLILKKRIKAEDDAVVLEIAFEGNYKAEPCVRIKRTHFGFPGFIGIRLRDIQFDADGNLIGKEQPVSG